MKQKYEKTVLTVTRFGSKDVITTSEIDRNNAYENINDLNDKTGRRIVPTA